MDRKHAAAKLAPILLLAVIAVAPREASAQSGPYQYFAITPCRLYDSRTGNPSALGTGGGMITTTLDNATGLRQLRARGACGVPTTAQALTVNHTVINPTATGPGGISRMCPSPLGGGQTICRAWVLYGVNETISNGGVLPLGVVGNPGTDNDFQIQGIGANPSGVWGTYTYDWTLDVTGYFQ
jgi:hypothetical protein